MVDLPGTTTDAPSKGSSPFSLDSILAKVREKAAPATPATGAPAAPSRLSEFTRTEVRKLPPMPAHVEEFETWQPSPSGTGASPTTAPAAQAQGYTPIDRALGQLGTRSTYDPVDRAKAELNPPEEGPKKPKTRRTYEMTWEDYSALTDRQKSAIDFNTELVQAREKDRQIKDPDAVPEQQRKTYENAVEEMFGTESGSDIYAPETLALLESIDYKPVDTDLDDFLNLKAAITEKDLAKIQYINPGGGTSPLTPNVQTAAAAPAPRVQMQEQLLEGTAAMQAQAVKTNTMLQNFDATSDAVRNEITAWFGGEPNKVVAQPGFGEGEPDKVFQELFEILADKSTTGTPEEITAQLGQRLSPEGIAQFFEYATSRAQNSSTYGQLESLAEPRKMKVQGPDGNTSKVQIQYRDAEELLELLGQKR